MKYSKSGYLQLNSGLLVPEGVFSNAGPLCVDLFCGCGGFSLGMMQAGWRVIAGLDSDPMACLTYLTNLGDYPCEFVFADEQDRQRLEKVMLRHFGLSGKMGKHKQQEIVEAGLSGSNRPAELLGVPCFFFGDVRKFTGAQILETLGLEVGELDCVCGGPPCQGFSRQNTKRNVIDPRNSLVFEFVRLVLEMQPKSLVMENVPGMLDMVTPAGLSVIDVICRALEDGGFGTAEALAKSLRTSAGCGAASRRNSGESKRKQKESVECDEQLPLF